MASASASSATRSASASSAAAMPSPRRSGSTERRPSRATRPRNSSRQVPTTRSPSSATRWTASWSRPSRSAAIETPCSPLNTRSRSSSAAAISASLCAGLTSRAASVPVDVGREVGLGSVGPDVDEGQLALAVVERRRREGLDAVELGGDLELWVLEVLVGDRLLRQESARVAVVVVRVHPDEDDVLVVLGDLAQQRELHPARPAPRGPLVDDDRRAALLVDEGVERRLPPVEQRVGPVGGVVGVIRVAGREQQRNGDNRETAHPAKLGRPHFGGGVL